MKKKKQNVRGGVECRVWLEKTFAKYDRNSPCLIMSDQDIGKMFCLNASSVARIRHELGIPAPRVRYRIASGRLGAEEKAVSVQEPVQKPTRPSLPAWVKDWQWVMDGEGVIGQIFDVHRSRHIVIVDYLRENRRGFAEISSLKPVRFRPYSYEEAKELLGKTMEYTVKNACASVHYSMLICNVSSNDNNGETFIHSCRFSDWVDCEATIDGVPIGVPEIDYEACRAKTPEE